MPRPSRSLTPVNYRYTREEGEVDASSNSDSDDGDYIPEEEEEVSEEEQPQHQEQQEQSNTMCYVGYLVTFILGVGMACLYMMPIETMEMVMHPSRIEIR